MKNNNNYEYLLKDLTELNGIGIKTMEILKKKKINNLFDLLWRLPKSYTDRSEISKVNELKIVKIVATNLKKNKIVFAGIDLISGYLTGDINITSPTGLKNYKDLTGINLAVDFWNYLEN